MEPSNGITAIHNTNRKGELMPDPGCPSRKGYARGKELPKVLPPNKLIQKLSGGGGPPAELDTRLILIAIGKNTKVWDQRVTTE